MVIKKVLRSTRLPADRRMSIRVDKVTVDFSPCPLSKGVIIKFCNELYCILWTNKVVCGVGLEEIGSCNERTVLIVGQTKSILRA